MHYVDVNIEHGDDGAVTYEPYCSCGWSMRTSGDARAERLARFHDRLNRNVRPKPGDAVRLTEQWNGAKASQVGIIQGVLGDTPDDASIMFDASTYRDDRVVRSSGGPGTISTDLSELSRTEEAITVPAWRWGPGGPGKGNGVGYTVTVPLWEWTPSNEGNSDDSTVQAIIRELDGTERELPDGAARVIASWHHAGQDSLGYAFVSTGAVPVNSSDLWRELFPDYDALDADTRRAADYLGTYLLAHAGRGPVPGWSGLWV